MRNNETPHSAFRTPNGIVGRIPYLNCEPFFHGWTAGEWTWADVSPRQLGQGAEAGRVVAGPMALADFARLQDRFERLGSLGIAVRGRCESVMLFSKRPIRQLDGATIAVTDETSTSAALLRLILEQRYKLSPAAYRRVGSPAAADTSAAKAIRAERSAGPGGGPASPAGMVPARSGGEAAEEALLLIGDEALRFGQTNRLYPYEIDLAFEWWLWQHLPMVFAVWAVRKDASPEFKQHLSRSLQKQLAINLARVKAIAEERAAVVGAPASAIAAYLERMVYRFGSLEERAVTHFAQLLHEHHLL